MSEETYVIPGMESLGVNTRRDFLRLAGVGGAGLLVASQIGCGASIATEIGIIQSTILALKPLLPNQAALLDKVSRLAGDFNTAYRAGNFSSAKDFFNSLADNIDTLIADVGVASPRVQFLVALVGVAIHAVAALLAEQGAASPKAGKMAGSMAPATVDRVQRMASPEVAAKLLQSVKAP